MNIIWRIRSVARIYWFRKMVHSLLNRWYKDGRIVNVARGPLKGMKWQCSSGEQFFMPMGVYEAETADWLLNALNEDSLFIDIGANAGYFTLLAAGKLKRGKVYAFEPVPSFRASIDNKVRLNSLTNVLIEPFAVSNFSGSEVDFEVEGVGANSHLSNIETEQFTRNVSPMKIKVPVTTLDDYCKTNNLRPSVIKMDVEGAEVLVLQGMGEVLDIIRPKMIISTHGDELLADCKKLLLERGYAVDCLKGFHHELIAIPRN